MTYDWYLVFNLGDFIDTELVSREFDILFPTGKETILVTKGNEYSMLYKETFLPLGLAGENPFAFDDHAIYFDSDYNVWLGILNED